MTDRRSRGNYINTGTVGESSGGCVPGRQESNVSPACCFFLIKIILIFFTNNFLLLFSIFLIFFTNIFDFY